jgi:hypothetical protein
MSQHTATTSDCAAQGTGRARPSGTRSDPASGRSQSDRTTASEIASNSDTCLPPYVAKESPLAQSYGVSTDRAVDERPQVAACSPSSRQGEGSRGGSGKPCLAARSGIRTVCLKPLRLESRGRRVKTLRTNMYR